MEQRREDPRHVNLFQDFAGSSRPASHPERVAEILHEKEQKNRSETAYLDSAKKGRTESWIESKVSQDPRDRLRRDINRKDILDPLHTIKKGEEMKRISESVQKAAQRSQAAALLLQQQKASGKPIDPRFQLHLERIIREGGEREKIARVMSQRLHGPDIADYQKAHQATGEVPPQMRGARYNEQFHPEAQRPGPAPRPGVIPNATGEKRAATPPPVTSKKKPKKEHDGKPKKQLKMVLDPPCNVPWPPPVSILELPAIVSALATNLSFIGELRAHPAANSALRSRRNHIAIGINECTKAAERGELALLLACREPPAGKGAPVMLAHLPMLCVLHEIPLAPLSGENATFQLGAALGLRTLGAIGFKKSLLAAPTVPESSPSSTSNEDQSWLQQMQQMIRDFQQHAAIPPIDRADRTWVEALKRGVVARPLSM
ncbi:hypothetical protein PAPYR_10368 [Paratrimastix pyriformis]|uniref:Uncharacterized protein n=1 Tax=Paratrimastix pyriformis TaxID=342808 RepID=A0ABQ8U689_9EUKA|nr:hypothetical protein PAPYR_10368 [Paratrimastix pyriformis]